MRSNTLKKKVGNGGLDRDLLEKSQQALDTAFSEKGAEWVADLVFNVSREHNAWMDSQPREGLALVSAALDLKSMAMGMNFDLMAALAGSLHSFVEVADPEDPRVVALVAAHVQAINALQAEDRADKVVAKKTQALLNELRGATKHLLSEG